MFSNANSFKAKIKNMAKDRGIPAQQLQQNFLIEQVLKPLRFGLIIWKLS